MQGVASMLPDPEEPGRLYFEAGGCYVPDIYGFGYVRELAQNYYGIQEVLKIEAAGLDIDGADIEKLMKDAEAAVEAVKIYRD